MVQSSSACIHLQRKPQAHHAIVLLLLNHCQQWSGNWTALLSYKLAWCSSEIFSVLSANYFTICHPTCCYANRSTFSHGNSMSASLPMHVWTAKIRFNTLQAMHSWQLCFCPKMTSEMISEHLENFLGRMPPHLPSLVRLYTSNIIIHVTPFLKIMATGLISSKEDIYIAVKLSCPWFLLIGYSHSFQSVGSS